MAAVLTVALATAAASNAAPGGPQALAERLAANDAVLRDAIDEWRAPADPPPGQAPESVVEPALFLQEQVRFLAKHPNAAKATLRRLPGRLARQIRELTVAARKLRRLSGGGPPRKLRVGKPRPLAELVGHYGKAERRHGVEVRYLAAINLVETKFGRVKSKSTAGARGPMQFIPSSWKIYGNGGNINDPHDAILAAARLLRDRGAPRSYGRALYAYNPSNLYVAAVQRYASVIARDRQAIHFLYCWGP
jgi:membrane-bound lytic murein transglycosylase B